ncbi:MAG: tRNA (guanosine(37)-N1)-methyltransferase TrmD, partial [Dehalococcoidia bacterium]|nr:tRNA (guanosine(37)-N1)-methyltransferase TrmD [Dehalococcoidia bacterium]
MRIDILTIFPKMFRGPFDESIVKRAVDSGLVSIHLHDVRRWAKDRHKTVDDYPYGGGPGMVMKPDVVFAAAEAVLELAPQRQPVVLLTPGGRRLTHEV